MNGAQTLVHTLADSGVEICFGNPGTSEMHVVAALDHEPKMRGVLCLFEGVAAGAASGYARMSGKPAACLLHLGPGFANAISFLHNARKAGQPVVNLVGDHATSHAQYAQAPLSSDIMAITGSVSDWLYQCQSAGRAPKEGRSHRHPPACPVRVRGPYISDATVGGSIGITDSRAAIYDGE